MYEVFYVSMYDTWMYYKVALIKEADGAVALDLVSVQKKTEEIQREDPIDFLQFVGEGAWILLKHISLQMGCVTRYQSRKNAMR